MPNEIISWTPQQAQHLVDLLHHIALADGNRSEEEKRIIDMVQLVEEVVSGEGEETVFFSADLSEVQISWSSNLGHTDDLYQIQVSWRKELSLRQRVRALAWAAKVLGSDGNCDAMELTAFNELKRCLEVENRDLEKEIQALPSSRSSNHRSALVGLAYHVMNADQQQSLKERQTFQKLCAMEGIQNEELADTLKALGRPGEGALHLDRCLEILTHFNLQWRLRCLCWMVTMGEDEGGYDLNEQSMLRKSLQVLGITRDTLNSALDAFRKRIA